MLKAPPLSGKCIKNLMFSIIIISCFLVIAFNITRCMPIDIFAGQLKLIEATLMLKLKFRK